MGTELNMWSLYRTNTGHTLYAAIILDRSILEVRGIFVEHLNRIEV